MNGSPRTPLSDGEVAELLGKIFVPLLVLLLLMYNGHHLTATEAVVTVEAMDAPRECGSSSTFLPIIPAFRSGPTPAHLGYCGAIETDRGFLMLPDENDVLDLFAPDRAALWDALRVGCTYRITHVGPRELRPRTFPLTKTMMSAAPMGSCPAD